MTLGERIKKVRQAKSLTQQAFGQKIGLKQNSIAIIESGKRDTSEQTIFSICREFHVREEWLREGKGEMFAPQDETTLLDDANLDNVDKAILKTYISLPMELRASIKEFALRLMKNIPAAQSPAVEPPAPTPVEFAIPKPPEFSDEEWAEVLRDHTARKFEKAEDGSLASGA